MLPEMTSFAKCESKVDDKGSALDFIYRDRYIAAVYVPGHLSVLER